MCSSFQAARLEHTAEFGAFSATFIVVENLTKGWTPHQILPYGSMPRTLCSGFNPEPACAWALHLATKSLNTTCPNHPRHSKTSSNISVDPSSRVRRSPFQRVPNRRRRPKGVVFRGSAWIHWGRPSTSEASHGRAAGASGNGIGPRQETLHVIKLAE